MQSKVVSIKFANEWNGPNGTVYYFDVEFENGSKGQVGSKKQDPAPWRVGDMAEFDVQPGREGYPDKIKKTFTPGGGGGGGGKWQPPTWETERLKIPTMATSVACNAGATALAAGKISKEEFMSWVHSVAVGLAGTMGEIAKKGGME